jgi:hypothetical protein
MTLSLRIKNKEVAAIFAAEFWTVSILPQNDAPIHLTLCGNNNFAACR